MNLISILSECGQVVLKYGSLAGVNTLKGVKDCVTTT